MREVFTVRRKASQVKGEKMRTELERIKRKYRKSERERKRYKRENASILKSKSWRYTAPARKLYAIISRLIGAKHRSQLTNSSSGEQGLQPGGESLSKSEKSVREREPYKRKDSTPWQLVENIKERLYALGFTDRALEDLEYLATDVSRPLLKELATWQ